MQPSIHRIADHGFAPVRLLLVATMLGTLALDAVSSREASAATAPDRDVTALVAAPELDATRTELNRRGFSLTENVIERRTVGGHTATMLGVEMTGTPTPDANDPEWSAATPFAAVVYEKDGEIPFISELRLDPDRNYLAAEIRFPSQPRVRVRMATPESADAEPRYEVLAQLPDGSFGRVAENLLGEPYFIDFPDSPLPEDLTWNCVKNCFLQLNTPLTWAQGLCIAIFLLACGAAAFGSGGAAAIPCIKIGLTGCGLTFLIGRVAALAVCLIQCW